MDKDQLVIVIIAVIIGVLTAPVLWVVVEVAIVVVGIAGLLVGGVVAYLNWLSKDGQFSHRDSPRAWYNLRTKPIPIAYVCIQAMDRRCNSMPTYVPSHRSTQQLRIGNYYLGWHLSQPKLKDHRMETATKEFENLAKTKLSEIIRDMAFGFILGCLFTCMFFFTILEYTT